MSAAAMCFQGRKSRPKPESRVGEPALILRATGLALWRSYVYPLISIAARRALLTRAPLRVAAKSLAATRSGARHSRTMLQNLRTIGSIDHVDAGETTTTE